MNRKLDSVTYLLISTMRSILQSPDNWREFLDTAARNYKYPFSDQVMIFAQKPDATAVASFDTWVSKLNRYVRRGSKGIVLIDQATNPPKLHYVFDVSDTGKGPHGKSVNFWEIRSEHVDAVHERLEHEFDAEGSTIPDQLIDIAAKLVINYWEDHQDDIDESWSYALNNSDNQSAWEDLQLITANSVAYILLKRAGYNPADYLNESCFDNVSAFQDETFQRNFLGTAVHHCSFSALHTIELSIKNFELEKKAERSATNEQRRNQVHESGRASVPESVSGRGSADAAGQMGLDAQNVSHGTPGAVVHDDANRRESVGASAGDRPVSNGDVRADDGQRSTELRRNKESESNRSDEMGRTNEHVESTSGRSNSSRSDLFVNSEPNVEQLSMFDFPVYPSENEQIQSMAEAPSANTPSAFSVSQEEIDRELRAYHGKLNIYGMYQQNLPTESIVAAIKKGYGICGHSTTLLDGTNAFVDFRPTTGMEFWRDPTDKKFIVKWSALENRIRQLIREGSYLTPKELEKYQSDHLEEHADVEVDISRDLTASAVQPTFFFGYNDIKHDHPDDIVLYQVGDFFEMYGEDAKNASTILNLSLTSRHIPDVGRVSMCGIPAHQLEQYVEQLRDEYDVTVAAIDEDNGQRKVHSVLSIDHEAERAINAHEAEYGADGWQAFPGNKPTPTVRELYNQYKPMISAAVVADEAYRNACRNSDRENAYLEGAAAVKRAVLASGDMQLLRLYSDMTEFHNRLHREVLDETYPKLQSQPRSMSQEDRFLSESEKQEPGIIGAVFEYDNTLYEVVKIDHDEDIGDLAVIRDMASPEDAPKMTVEPLEFVQILVQEQQMPAVASSQGKAVSERDYSYEYRLLDRLHNDCEYFLGAGQRSEKHLWAGNVHAQIAKMRELYETLPENPEWLTEEAINSYADRMAPRYLVVAYHHFENGFDEKLDYQTLPEAEKAAQGYVAGTMEHDGFAYDGAAVYDQQERKYLRIYGDYPDEAAKAQVEVPVYEASKSILSDSLFPAQEVPQAVIDQALYTAGNSYNSAYRVAVFYMRERPEADCIAFLRREFDTENGRGIEYEGRKYAVWFMEDGIHLAQGDSVRTGHSPTVVTWERVSARILELLEAGTYLSTAELEQAPDKVLSEMADALLMTARDLSEEGRAKGLFSQTLAIYDQPKGYPELDEDMVAVAKSDGGLTALAEEYHAFFECL